MAWKTNISPTGRDGARPLQGERSRAVYGGVRLGCGFRQPNSETEFGASVMVTPPYGCNAGGSQRRADVGIGPYGKERTPHQPPGLAAQSGASAARMGGMGRERGRDHPPKGPSTPDNPSVTAKPCQLPLHKGAFGDGGCGLPRRSAPRNDSPDPLSFRGGPTGRRGNPSFLRWTRVRAAEVVGPYAPRGTGERHAGVVVPYGWSQGGLINCRGSA